MDKPDRPGAADGSGAHRSAPAPRAVPEVVSLDEVRLRNRALARERVAVAQGILLERYRLPAPDDAFALLRTVSQACNVTLRVLAEAFIGAPAPAPGADRWFPGLSPLADSESRQGRERMVPLRTVLSSALARAVDAGGTHMGNVQLIQGPYLRLETHTGLDEQFTEYFAFVADGTTACSQAAASHRPVTVHDVTTAQVFSTEARQVVLASGARAVHSIPLLSPTRRLLGVLSTHHRDPLNHFTGAQHTALQNIGLELGAQLSWHRRHHVLAALEHLHQHAHAHVPEQPGPH